MFQLAGYDEATAQKAVKAVMNIETRLAKAARSQVELRDPHANYNKMDMETLLPQVANYGFPMVLSWYLLVRMEGRLDRLTDSINSLARSIAAGKTA